MSNPIYNHLNLVGTSPESIDDAIRNAVHKATEMNSAIGWFEVTDIRGSVGGNQVRQFQVSLKVGVRLD